MTTQSRMIVTSLALVLCGAAHAQHGPWTTPPVSASGVQYRTFQSANAGAAVSFHVWLPPQYQSMPTERFPVLYWLHGSGSPIAGIPWVSSWFGNAMAQGKIPPMLVVFPNGMGASMWCNSEDGEYLMESVVIEDLIPHVDATFRTIAERRAQAHVVQCTEIRLGTGSLDAMLGPMKEFHAHLLALGIPHENVVVPGVDHDPVLTLQGLSEAGWAFYHRSLATPCPQPADVNCSGMVDGADLGVLLGAWGPGDGVADINGDAVVDGADLGLLVAAWGSTPPP